MSGNLRKLLDAARDSKDESESDTLPVEPERPHKAGAGETGEAKRGPGRPGGGKRSNPDYERLNLLVRKTTRHKVDLRMLNEPGDAADISELVDRLLSEWAKT